MVEENEYKIIIKKTETRTSWQGLEPPDDPGEMYKSRVKADPDKKHVTEAISRSEMNKAHGEAIIEDIGRTMAEIDRKHHGGTKGRAKK